MSEAKRFCTFKVAESLLGVEVERVQEIIRFQVMPPIPLAPPEVAGLINLRGDIVPALDLRRCLKLEGTPKELEASNVVLRTDGGAVALLVDEIGEVLEVTEDSYERPPDTMKGVLRKTIRGVYKLEKGLLMVLATDAVIDVATPGHVESELRITSRES